MSFIADKQTREDLNLLGKYQSNSIYSLFNKVRSAGAEKILEEMFRYPLTDAGAINKRSALFRYFQQQALDFPFRGEQLRIMEDFLGAGGGNIFSTALAISRKKWMGVLIRDEGYGLMLEGMLTTIEVLNGLLTLLDKLDHWESPYRVRMVQLRSILDDTRLAWLSREKGATHLPLLKLARYDHLLRQTMRSAMEMILKEIYYLDIYIAVSRIAGEKGFWYAQALPKEKYIFSTSALRHPGLESGVPNPVGLHGGSNMLFLTGANMAGKSTFMKAFGIAVYLAHMGFPVAAEEMVFSVRDGIYSSINMSDNLALGYSHFYAEVLRVKEVAEEVSRGKDLVVVFDELFKGTNVKDAYDATLAVTQAFSAYRNCFFILSTHIIEVGEALGKVAENLQFVYLPTILQGSVPAYTYRLEQGITADRHGMMIIENERILEMLG